MQFGAAMRRLAILLVLAGSNVAVAEPERATERYAVAVNNPIGWLLGNLSTSGWVALDEHFAIRANIALYSAHASYISMIEHGFEVYPITGRTSDFGAGLVWAPRRMWSGPTFELGALLRFSDHTTHPDIDSRDITRDTTLAGVRAMVGWNRPISRRAFVAAGIGVSVGRERGTTFEHEHDDRTPLGMVTRIDETVIDLEVYLRFGVRLGSSSAR